MTKDKEREEGLRLTRQYQEIKEKLKELGKKVAELDLAHKKVQNGYEIILGDIDDRAAKPKKALGEAKVKIKEAEAARKAAYEVFKATPKTAENYAKVKEDLEKARTAKKEAEATRDKAQENYQKAIAPFAVKLKEVTDAKEKASKDLKAAKEELKKIREEFAKICQKCFERSDALELFDAEMTELTEDIIETSEKINLLKPWLDVAKAIVRDFVSNNPTGWSTGELEAAKRYLIWINIAERLGVILEDNPEYDYDFNEIANLLGLNQILNFVRLDKKVLENTAKTGNLKDKHGKPITYQELLKWRKQELKTPKVKPFYMGNMQMEDVIIQLTPEFLKEDLDPLEKWQERGWITPGIVKALKAAGITTISRLQKMSFLQVANIRGIGPKKAARLFRALRR